jgi:hypothetical protein
VRLELKIDFLVYRPPLREQPVWLLVRNGQICQRHLDKFGTGTCPGSRPRLPKQRFWHAPANNLCLCSAQKTGLPRDRQRVVKPLTNFFFKGDSMVSLL